jgi:quinol monooxygenase YgiN
MVEIIYKVLTKPGQAQTFKTLAEETLIPEALKLPACKLFTLFQNTQNNREFIFHEKWDTHESVDQYKQNLIAILGDPKPGEEFPAKMNNLLEADEDLI